MPRRPAKPKQRTFDWQITRITGKGARVIGEVQASDADAAIKRAIEKYDIAAEQQSRVAARPIIASLGRVLINRDRSHSPIDAGFAPTSGGKADVPEGPSQAIRHLTHSARNRSGAGAVHNIRNGRASCTHFRD